MITTEDIGKYYYLFPQSVAMVSVKKNIMPAAWHTAISAKPPLYGISISPKRHTFDLLIKSRGFTVSFVELKHAEMIAKTGGCSGLQVEKVKKLEIAHELGKKIDGLILSDAYAAYECRKFKVQEYGDHHFFVGEIVLIHFRDDILGKENMVDPGKVKPALYFGKDRYLTIDAETVKIHKR